MSSSSDLPLSAFEFATATRIIFGCGTINQIGAIINSVQANGKSEKPKLFVVTGKSKNRAKPLFDLLEKFEFPFSSFEVPEEPTIELASKGLEMSREQQCEIVISIGGGSVIDTGKAIAALISNGGEFIDYMEVIGKGRFVCSFFSLEQGKSLSKPSVPFIAIPTTAGTGAEVTRNSVLSSEQHKQKASIRSAFMLPSVALIDPDLSFTMPKEVTASTGLDAFTQLLEPFVSNKANPLTDALCREGLRRVGRSLKKAYEEGNNKEAREDMSIGSLFGGLALANAKLGSVHGFAGVIGGMFKEAPHGSVCAALLPHCIHANVVALRARSPNSSYLHRYSELATILTGKQEPEELVNWIIQLCKDLNVPKLSTYGIKKEDIQIIVEKSANSSSMQGNCIQLTKEELSSIMYSAF